MSVCICARLGSLLPRLKIQGVEYEIKKPAEREREREHFFAVFCGHTELCVCVLVDLFAAIKSTGKNVRPVFL